MRRCASPAPKDSPRPAGRRQFRRLLRAPRRGDGGALGRRRRRDPRPSSIRTGNEQQPHPGLGRGRHRRHRRRLSRPRRRAGGLRRPRSSACRGDQCLGAFDHRPHRGIPRSRRRPSWPKDLKGQFETIFLCVKAHDTRIGRGGAGALPGGRGLRRFAAERPQRARHRSQGRRAADGGLPSSISAPIISRPA